MFRSTPFIGRCDLAGFLSGSSLLESSLLKGIGGGCWMLPSWLDGLLLYDVRDQ